METESSAYMDITEDVLAEQMVLSTPLPSLPVAGRRGGEGRDKHTMSTFPTEILPRIFQYLTGDELLVAEQVCRTWRAEIRLKKPSLDLWKRVCTQYSIPFEEWRQDCINEWDMMLRRPSWSEAAAAFLSNEYRSLYVRHRRHICTACSIFSVDLSGWVVGPNVILCKECRHKGPNLTLTRQKVKNYFNFDPLEVPHLIQPSNMNSHGCKNRRYRFQDVFDISLQRDGRVRAEEYVAVYKMSLV